MNPRLTLSALAAATALLLAPAAFAQAKSNIQDDPNSSSCTQNCADAGYAWAEENSPTSDDDCAASNADFADGCKHWLQEQRDMSAPPPDDSAAPAPEDAPQGDDSNAPPPDDSSAPPPDDSSEPQPDDSAPPPPNNQ